MEKISHNRMASIAEKESLLPGRRKMRQCRPLRGGRNFKPSGIPSRNLEKVYLKMDEFEAVRLCDHDGLNQIEAAEKMEISRGTVQRLLNSGRYKITEALLSQKELIILEDQEDIATFS